MIKVIKKADVKDLRNFMYNEFPKCADDPKLYECLNSGKAINVFQMSAGTASQVVEQIKPDNLSELTACNAFSRPGCIDNVPSYIAGKAGNLKYHNEIINSVFGETFGVCIFQESVMRIFCTICDEDGSYGNLIRGLLKKLSKANKKQEDIDAWKKETEKFEQKAKEKNIPADEVVNLVKDIEMLANYSFNKSHALAYSMMAAWTLYLNVYFKKFYYPAVIEYAFAHDKDTLENLKDMKRFGFNIIPPNLINSKARTYSSGNDIFVGLHNLKSVGDASNDIVASSPYSSFEDFLNKNLINSKVNKRAVTALVEFGCFDELEKDITRHQMISCFSYYWENKPAFKKISEEDAKLIQENPEAGNKVMEAVNAKIKVSVDFWNEVKNQAIQNGFSVKDDRNFLKECEEKYLGFNFFVSPFDKEISAYLSEKINKGIVIDGFTELKKNMNISKVVPVFISSIRQFKDKNGGDMCFMSLEDRNGETATVPIFASAFKFVSDKISEGVVALMLLYNTNDDYRGGTKIMLGTKKWVDPNKYSSFIIPLKQEKT